MTQAMENPRVHRLPMAPGGRVPPHDLDAEESLLGAMLLSRDAIAAALECCAAEDFYKPAHAHIFAAVTALYTRGEPADPVTVADELRRAGLLEAVGDPSVLIHLQVSTPSTANASHYAKIVEEHALLRRLVSVAGEIAELGYSVPEDVSEVIDRAESLVFEVAQRRVVDTMSSLRDLLAASLDHLENLYARGDTITGVPTGYTDLDERLAGLQRSNLVVVGARPAMGKALALDTPIPTPSGWTTMAGLQVGDEVFDEHGVPCRVDYTSPVFTDHECYRVRFDDGSELVADAGHRWLAWDHEAFTARCAAAVAEARATWPPRRPTPGPRVVTTAELVAEGVRTMGGGKPNWHIPVCGALDGPDADLPVDPYVLGCWLGDGRVGFSEITVDEEDAAHFVSEFEGRGYVLARRAGLQWTVSAKLTVGEHSVRFPALVRELHSAGLRRGAPKRIPTAYLRASAKQRLELLQGLMDSTGTVADDGLTVELRLPSRIVIEQVRELAASLGHKPSPAHRTVHALPGGWDVAAWHCSWSPLDPVFRLSRKADKLVSRAGGPGDARLWRAVVAVEHVPTAPTRCISVSAPSHLFLAGRAMVPTHNTSFALGIVANAAVHARVPVLLFSLEMSHLELTQRLLCSEARVDATRMRNGRLLESDWPKISDAIGRLGDAPIYIDDNPNVTVMDIRAKARRLKARDGLGLVVVDYLQLMSGHSRSRAENRQVEVSEISRGLKVLARELDIPVLALSQLSRNLEMRQDKRPVLADLRESGCLTADTGVTRADTGAEVTMGELLQSGERDIPVWALDERLRLVPATMSHVFPSGTKRTFELRLASGRRVQASANHPFRTVLGWRRLDELQIGDRLAVAHELPAFGLAPTFRGQSPRPFDTDQCSGDVKSTTQVLDDLRVHSGGAVSWDDIVAIDDRGEELVYDATVHDHHNFLANGIVAHNSIEQDSDVVMFIYRDEVYNPDSADRGSAEIIIAKHRNGPVGVTQLAFMDHHTRFANQARV